MDTISSYESVQQNGVIILYVLAGLFVVGVISLLISISFLIIKAMFFKNGRQDYKPLQKMGLQDYRSVLEAFPFSKGMIKLSIYIFYIWGLAFVTGVFLILLSVFFF